MPQLMPLFWLMSSYMFLYIFMMILFLYFYKKNEYNLFDYNFDNNYINMINYSW